MWLRSHAFAHSAVQRLSFGWPGRWQRLRHGSGIQCPRSMSPHPALYSPLFVKPPSIAQVQAALEALQSATTDVQWFGRPRGEHRDLAVRTASLSEGTIGAAARAYQASRNDLNYRLLRRLLETEIAASRVVWPYLSSLFEVEIPGVVSLPVAHSGENVSLFVVGLESLGSRSGSVFGVARTSRQDGGDRGTRAFTRHGNALVWL